MIESKGAEKGHEPKIGLTADDRLAGYSVSHQIRERSLRLLVSTCPSSASSDRRAWAHRRESGSSSATARAVTAGPSLRRMTVSSSSSLTVRGRPAFPMSMIHPTRVINGSGTATVTSDKYKWKTYIGCNRVSQSPLGLFEAPARHSRAGLASRYDPEAMQANVLRSLESTGSIDTDQHEQTYLDHFGFVPASQRRLDDDREDQEATQ